MPKNKQIRVVFDTNIWIHFLWSNKLAIIDKYIFNKTIQLIYSDETINELTEILSRKKFRNRISLNQIDELLIMFENYGQKFNIVSSHEICRDKKDNFLINLCIDSKADYLITGDADLLVCDLSPQTTILTISNFIDLLNKK